MGNYFDERTERTVQYCDVCGCDEMSLKRHMWDIRRVKVIEHYVTIGRVGGWSEDADADICERCIENLGLTPLGGGVYEYPRDVHVNLSPRESWISHFG